MIPVNDIGRTGGLNARLCAKCGKPASVFTVAVPSGVVHAGCFTFAPRRVIVIREAVR